MYGLKVYGNVRGSRDELLIFASIVGALRNDRERWSRDLLRKFFPESPRGKDRMKHLLFNKNIKLVFDFLSVDDVMKLASRESVAG